MRGPGEIVNKALNHVSGLRYTTLRTLCTSESVHSHFVFSAHQAIGSAMIVAVAVGSTAVFGTATTAVA